MKQGEARGLGSTLVQPRGWERVAREERRFDSE